MSHTTPSLPTANRVNSLDYLRGLAALGIMLYHMHLFTFGEADASTLFARIKIYDVSIFYVLSGLTLCVVHLNNFNFSKQGLREFYIKRFFRIVPLLWLATLLTFVVAYNPEYLSVKKLIANILIIPGAIKPETFIANGAWSIGDELFFYMLFPFVMLLGLRSKPLFIAFVIITLLVLAYFSIYKLDENKPLGSQWAVYVNPIGQMFYFVVGIGIGFMSKGLQRLGRWSLLAMVLTFALIVFYPAYGEPVHLVTGVTRLVLSLLVAVLCFLVYKTNFDFLPSPIQKMFTILGEISFSLYLIHPIIYYGLKNWLKADPYVLVALTITSSLVLSYFSYKYFEMYFIKLGKRVNNRYKPALL
jgi:exopolysaccharide production protein ExoZ